VAIGVVAFAAVWRISSLQAQAFWLLGAASLFASYQAQNWIFQPARAPAKAAKVDLRADAKWLCESVMGSRRHATKRMFASSSVNRSLRRHRLPKAGVQVVVIRQSP